ncbi:PREDICTED: uncharacterized protein LOC106748142 [Dinoponera quadriceps]|uniref:Uncharacterized protein LOC106748142 n=1 Tax=Dinoponera quadriceps TaxID=609295 RepID=A0A6P3XVE4_DINQU|nr:PREDICTED: uncharacterized protein LOC106748142 [Dinoponera quadriceps]
MKTIRRGDWCRLLVVAAILSGRANAEKHKRQIFREQVLPALGGKIPEEAFRTDRLALNRLNKEGISVPDGVVFDARRVQKHPHPDQRMPEVIKVYLTSDGRYVPPEGRIHYNHPKAVDTTYIIRRPFMRTNHKPTSNNFESVKLRSYPKITQTYSNYGQFVPVIPPKPGVYKPIITPLILPTDKDLFDLSGWQPGYNWDTVYEPFDDYFVDDIALFDSHQIITDYQGFLNEFHGRSLRHVNPKSNNRNQQQARQNRKHAESKMSPIPYQKTRSHIRNSRNSAYTNLTNIPETNFSCNGRKGTYADVETKCQVFHNCSGWSKTSSLCPPGTAFCETCKRCERYDHVQCGQNWFTVSFIFKLGTVMPRSRCVFTVFLLAVLAAPASFIQIRVEEPLPGDDYYNKYQQFQPVAGFRRPIVVEEEKPKSKQDFSKIPGIPGVDFPIYHTVPPTSFSCANVPVIPGMYANVETGCQAYHVCHDGREGHQGAPFLCTNGTLFNQREFACDWWYNVNCADALTLYKYNADPQKNPYVPKETKDLFRDKLPIVFL